MVREADKKSKKIKKWNFPHFALKYSLTFPVDRYMLDTFFIRIESK
jgi:hypothetical protein